MNEKELRLERATGIGPASEAWEASILPMNYARKSGYRGQTSANRMRVTMVAGLGDVRESPTPGTVARQVFNPLSDGAVRLDQVSHHCGASPKQGGILTQGRAVNHKRPPEISGQGIVHGLLHGT